LDTETDNALMKRVQAGDTGQLAVLFERHHLALFRYLLGMTGNRALSEDVVQDVFFRLIKYAASFDPGMSFPVWLYQMARNVYFDSQTKRRREVFDHPLQELEDTEPMPDEMVRRKQDADFLKEALRRLPADKREVLVLSRFRNLRYEEIGHILKCEAGTVKVRVYRALKALRETFCELRGEKVYDA
jgi:RNA polymerase sigma-70 factor (ECF subfamily)